MTYTATKTKKGKKTFYEVKADGKTIFTRESTRDDFKFILLFLNPQGVPLHAEYRTQKSLLNPRNINDYKFVEIVG